ncbi:MAG: hypothetical protein WA853_20195 [Candidatus Acidiferrum sp.]
MWTYLLGPFLSLLPQQARKALPFYSLIAWRPATIISGTIESILAVSALIYWYWYSMSTWISLLLDRALVGKTAVGTTDHHIATAALLIWATHPLTWGIAFVGIEGTARACAALTDTILGTFPLFLLDKIISLIFGSGGTKAAAPAQFSQSHVTSYVGAIRDRVAERRSSNIPDELCVARNSAEEMLEIRASRSKPEWNPPRIVRFQDNYYRLEECVRGAFPRPFIYRLRRLSKGVPGRTVLIYAPAEEPVKASR